MYKPGDTFLHKNSNHLWVYLSHPFHGGIYELKHTNGTITNWTVDQISKYLIQIDPQIGKLLYG